MILETLCFVLVDCQTTISFNRRKSVVGMYYKCSIVDHNGTASWFTHCIVQPTYDYVKPPPTTYVYMHTASLQVFINTCKT